MSGLEIIVKGKVQGVWFRASTKRMADQLNIGGSVENLEDGRVRILATGAQDAMNQFLAWCKKGPELARVDSLETRSMGVHADQFTIIRKH